MLGDVFAVTYGKELGVPKSITWYVNDNVEVVKSSNAGSLTMADYTTTKVGKVYAVVTNDKDETWTSNTITVTNKEISAKLSAYKISEDYSDPAHITLAADAQDFIVSVTMNKQYAGKFYMAKASTTKYKTSEMVGSAVEINNTNFTAKTDAKEMTEKNAFAAGAGKGIYMVNDDNTVTYMFRVTANNFTRGSEYKLIFDQTNVKEDTLTSNEPDATTDPTTKAPNITEAFVAPYVTAPAAIGVSDVTSNIAAAPAAKAALYTDAGMTKVADYLTMNGVTTFTSGGATGGIKYYANKKYDTTSGKAFTTAQTSVVTAGKDAGTSLKMDAASDYVTVYATFTAPKGIFGASELTLTSAYKTIPVTTAGVLSVSYDKANVKNIKVDIAGQRSAGTVYLLKSTDPLAANADALTSGEIDTAAVALVGTFDKDNTTKYVAKKEVAKTDGSVTFTDVLTGIGNTDRAEGDLYAAVFIPSEDGFATATTSDHTGVLNVVPKETTYSLEKAVAGPKAAATNTLAVTGAFNVKDQFGQNMSLFATELESPVSMTKVADTTTDAAFTLTIGTNGDVSVAVPASKTLKTSDAYKLTTTYGTFNLKVTKAGTTAADGTASDAEFELTFVAK